jgi:hypothetical protein
MQEPGTRTVADSALAAREDLLPVLPIAVASLGS